MPSERQLFLDTFESNLKTDRQNNKFFILDERADTTAHYTYEDLKEKATALAQHLINANLQGEKVLLLFPAGFDFIVGLLGCFYANAIAVPLNIPHGKQVDRVFHVMKDCMPSAILTISSVLNALTENSGQNFIQQEKKCEFGSIHYAPIKNEHEKTKTQESTNIAVIQYTSGSTSAPKGVMITYGNMVYMVSYIPKTVGLTPNDKSLTWLPNYHDMGLFEGLLTPIYSGYPVYIMSPATFIKNPLIWMEAISRYGITHSGGPNFSYDLCADKLKSNSNITFNLSTWRSAYNAAEPIRKETLDKFLNAAISHGFNPSSYYCCYGLAESVLMVTCHAGLSLKTFYANPSRLRQNVIEASTTENATALVGSGRAQQETKIAIVSPESKQALPVFQVGEIWVSGPAVAAGYWNNAAATAESFNAYITASEEGPFLRTGDLGFVDSEGNLFVTGRIKDTIIINGENYYPTDIEHTAEAVSPFSKIHDAAVFSLAKEDEIVLVLRVKNFPADYAFNVLAENIAKNVYEMNNVTLHHILFTEQVIPKTSSGKIQRQFTKMQFINQTILPTHRWSNPHLMQQEKNDRHVAIENQFVFWLATHRNMRIDSIDKTADFSVFGLDSIKIVDMLNAVEKLIGLAIPLHVVQDHPSIEQLARYLASSQFIEETNREKNNPIQKSTSSKQVVIPEFRIS